MNAQFEQNLLETPVPGAFNLWRRVGQILTQAPDLKSATSDVAACLGSSLGLDRSIVMVKDQAEPSCHLFRIQGEYCRPPLTCLGQQQYEVQKNSEVFSLMAQAKPLPLKDIQLREESQKADTGELSRFVDATKSRSLVAFPMVRQGEVLGFLSMHYVNESRSFSDEMLELGEAVALQLTLAIDRLSILQESSLATSTFKDMRLPAFIVERESFRIKKLNERAKQLLTDDVAGFSLLQVMPTAKPIIDASKRLEEGCASIQDIQVTVRDETLFMDALLVALSEEKQSDFITLLCPHGSYRGGGTSASLATPSSSQDLISTLSKQLTWERWVRQISSQIHATLDRDALLQLVVDGLGRALNANRCLMIRTDGSQTLTVTHEYAEPSISPLGLGRTGQFPTNIVSYFQRKAKAVPDISLLQESGILPHEDLETLAENGIRSMAGVPVSHHGVTYGVIILLESGSARQWAAHEMEMLEVVAYQTAIALGHSQSYQQVKDQLFNMNLLANLTQQLTNTLELASKAGKAGNSDERLHTGHAAPPLSLRELEVLKLITAGLANREIAQRLFLTESTVELHASRIRKKLKLKSRTALVKYACDHGLA